MRRLFNEAIKIIEADVTWLHDAAERFEEVAHILPCFEDRRRDLRFAMHSLHSGAESRSRPSAFRFSTSLSRRRERREPFSRLNLQMACCVRLGWVGTAVRGTQTLTRREPG
jgi:hypothetical protein